MIDKGGIKYIELVAFVPFNPDTTCTDKPIYLSAVIIAEQVVQFIPICDIYPKHFEDFTIRELLYMIFRVGLIITNYDPIKYSGYIDRCLYDKIIENGGDCSKLPSFPKRRTI